MNIYEAVEASPIRAARHETGRIIEEHDCHFHWWANNKAGGWQPLAVLEQYTLGEPLTEATKGQNYIAVRNDEVDQGVFAMSYPFDTFDADWTYYADPRPWPQKPEVTTDYNAVNKITGKMSQGTPRPRPKRPEVKEEPKLFANYVENCHVLTDEGRARLERLLREDV